MPPPNAAADETPASAPGTEVPLSEADTLLTSFSAFLTITIHTILFYRKIYPPRTFLTARAYNLPVHQSRHPKVCSWVRDAVDAVTTQIARGNVARVAVVIHSPPAPAAAPKDASSKSPKPPPPPPPPKPSPKVPPGSVLERWMFDVSRFPVWPRPVDVPKDPTTTTDDDDQQSEEGESSSSSSGESSDDETDPDAATTADETINWEDVDEQLRGTIRRLAYSGAQLDELPQGCTFTVAVELRDDGKPPIGHPQPWIPSQPSLQPASKSRRIKGRDIGGKSTTPIRSVEAGPLFFECWVEEGKAKDVLRQTSTKSTSSS